ADFRRRRRGGRIRLHDVVAGVFSHAKNSCALISALARVSTSALVLYMPNEARHVAVTPKRASSGMVQWVPARTATPDRSITVAMSWAWAPFISNETIGPLSRAVPMMRSELI